jgi:hypothetical protein
MKCPKCHYTSFDYLDNCKHCGVDLRDTRSLLQIIAVSPEDQAPAAPVVEMRDEEPMDKAAPAAAAAFLSAEDLGGEEEILDGLDFDGSFDELVEPTSHMDQAAEAVVAREPEENLEEQDDEELLDLDFGDLFEEKEK